MTPLRGLYIYLTDACNLRCVHCFQSAELPSRGQPALRFTDCERFLDAARGMGLQHVTLSGGEPMMNRDFAEFVRYFHRHSIRCAVETNGTLLQGRLLDVVVECGARCAISVDGATAYTHNLQRRRDYAFDRTVAALRRLEAAGVEYQLIMSLSRLNRAELEPLLDWIATEWRHCWSLKINPVNPSGRATDMERNGLVYSAPELVQLGKDVGALIHRYPFHIILHVYPPFFDISAFQKPYMCDGFCGYTQALSILATGAISICSLGKMVPSHVFGDVRTIDLPTTWSSHPLLARVHDKPYLQVTGVCSRCVFRRQCQGGCRAQALMEYGDFFAPMPQCQALWESGKFPQKYLIPDPLIARTAENV